MSAHNLKSFEEKDILIQQFLSKTNFLLNLLQTSVGFLYPLKTSENL